MKLAVICQKSKPALPPSAGCHCTCETKTAKRGNLQQRQLSITHFDCYKLMMLTHVRLHICFLDTVLVACSCVE